MNVLLNNPWTCLVLVIWLICAVVSIANKKVQVMEIAFWFTFWLGFVYILVKL